jgi:hypothetical protein
VGEETGLIKDLEDFQLRHLNRNCDGYKQNSITVMHDLCGDAVETGM